MALAPGRVRDLGDDRLEALAVRGEAVVEAHGVEAVAEGAQVGEQADRALRRAAEAFGDQRAHCVGQRHRGISEVVAAAEAHEPWARAHQTAPEQVGQLVKVDVGHRDPVAELVQAHGEAAMPDAALV